jgi:hypothetical protein
MVVDRYTKAVLTVIAGCLLWLCAVGTPDSVSAQSQTPVLGPATPVVVVGTGTLRRDGVVTVAYRNDRTDPTLPVSLPYSPTNPLPAHLTYSADVPLNVEVNAIRRGAAWEPLRVAVEDAPTRGKPGIGRH